MRFCCHGGDTVVVEQGDKIQMDAWNVKTLRSNRQGTAIVFNNKEKLVLTGLTPYDVITQMDVLA